jgi:hypothetical protein
MNRPPVRERKYDESPPQTYSSYTNNPFPIVGGPGTVDKKPERNEIDRSPGGGRTGTEVAFRISTRGGNRWCPADVVRSIFLGFPRRETAVFQAISASYNATRTPPHLPFVQLHALAVGLGDQLDERVLALPGHRSGEPQRGWDAVQHRPVPVLLQCSPAPLDRVVLAVVRWVQASRTASPLASANPANRLTYWVRRLLFSGPLSWLTSSVRTLGNRLLAACHHISTTSTMKSLVNADWRRSIATARRSGAAGCRTASTSRPP